MSTNAQQRVSAVIGANFGDEGKGLFTDFLSCQQENSIVVRYNGGAQAGHTVVSNGVRHVFSHFGSGSFNGCPTYLSRFFVCNPLIFHREHNELIQKGLQPVLHVDAQCLITTPYDMILNQVVEKKRATKRHGSVGLGFNETIQRSNEAAYALRVADLLQSHEWDKKLKNIRDHYVLNRAKALEVADIIQQDYGFIFTDAFIEQFTQDCQRFMSQVHISDLTMLRSFDHVVFEGAQGLLLDQHSGFFPYVTHSNTGVKNIVQLMSELNMPELDVVYATRSYLTRHGAGPMPHELAHKPYEKIVDPTNVPNEFQGHLRFAYLDMDLLFNAVHKDLVSNTTSVKINHRFGISCLDQVDGKVSYHLEGQLLRSGIDAFLSYFTQPYVSFGNERHFIEATHEQRKHKPT